ncbi:hypothetical protein AB0M11_26690 [Streptomyces sp. NPDC051987]|uniref:hypothetical protein n=1 Tax=Streptomyces sp. NPDC051987 TaxID=3155808 RepID=UPI003441A5D7
MARWFSGRLGRRGPFLVFMGAGKVCWGAGMIVAPPSVAGLGLLTHFAPLHCWASVWILAGVVTFCSAWWPFARDVWGFVAASVPPTLWAFAYAWGGLVDGYSRGLWVFAWYMTSHCGVIWCASRVPPEPVAVVEGRR